jgi:hypothetical protein
MDNKRLNSLACKSAVVFNSLLLIAAIYFLWDFTAEGQEATISFKLYGTHAEYTVSQTAEALGWNVTAFEPLSNGTIIVNATTTIEGEGEGGGQGEQQQEMSSSPSSLELQLQALQTLKNQSGLTADQENMIQFLEQEIAAQQQLNQELEQLDRTN